MIAKSGRPATDSSVFVIFAPTFRLASFRSFGPLPFAATDYGFQASVNRTRAIVKWTQCCHTPGETVEITTVAGQDWVVDRHVVDDDRAD